MENKTIEKPYNPLDGLGKYAIEGGPGRPPGLKNKFTLLKEKLVDCFDKYPGSYEALQRTIFEVKNGKDYVNLEALRAILSVLPSGKSDGESSGNNITIVINNGTTPKTIDVEVSDG